MSKCPVRSVQCPQLSRGGPQLSSWDRGGPALPPNNRIIISVFLFLWHSWYLVLNLPCSQPEHVWGGGRCSGGGSGYSVAAAEFWVAAQCKFSWNCLHTASCLRIISCFLNEQNTSRNPAPCTLARDGGAEHKLLIASDINHINSFWGHFRDTWVTRWCRKN